MIICGNKSKKKESLVGNQWSTNDGIDKALNGDIIGQYLTVIIWTACYHCIILSTRFLANGQHDIQTEKASDKWIGTEKIVCTNQWLTFDSKAQFYWMIATRLKFTNYTSKWNNIQKMYITGTWILSFHIKLHTTSC